MLEAGSAGCLQFYRHFPLHIVLAVPLKHLASAFEGEVGQRAKLSARIALVWQKIQVDAAPVGLQEDASSFVKRNPY